MAVPLIEKSPHHPVVLESVSPEIRANKLFLLNSLGPYVSTNSDIDMMKGPVDTHERLSFDDLDMRMFQSTDLPVYIIGQKDTIDHFSLHQTDSGWRFHLVHTLPSGGTGILSWYKRYRQLGGVVEQLLGVQRSDGTSYSATHPITEWRMDFEKDAPFTVNWLSGLEHVEAEEAFLFIRSGIQRRGHLSAVRCIYITKSPFYRL